MSYSGYNYSPYFQYSDQQPTNGQQQSYRQQQSGAGAHYRTHQASPVNGYSSAQQQPSTGSSPSHSISTVFAYPGYGCANDNFERTGRGNAIPHPPAYFAPNARPPYVDTSALGSLAYVSALGRDSPSVEHTAAAQQLPPHRDSNASPNYGSTMSRPINTSHQSRPDSQDSRLASNVIYNRSVPYTTAVAASALAQSQGQAPVRSESSAAASPTQSQGGNSDSLLNGHSNQQHPARQGYGTSREGPYIARNYPSGYQPMPPPSYQSPLTQQAQPSHHPVSSEQRKPASQKSNTTNGTSNDHRSSNNIEQRIASPRQEYDAPMHRPMPFHEQARNSDGNRSTTATRAEEGLSNHTIPVQSQQAAKSPDRPSTTANEKVNGTVKMVPHISSDNPMTVDPNQVFNQYEHQRRQAAAGVKAKAAREVMKDNLPQEIVDSNGFSSKQPPVQTGLNADLTTSTANSSKEKKEAKIKASFGSFIAQMRDLKAQDPSMFLEVWEEFKKGQPPIRSSSQAPNPVKESRSSTATSSRAMEVNSPIIPENGQPPSPSLIHNQPALMAEVDETGPVGQTPDLGRFPVQRRRRNSKIDKEILESGQPYPSGGAEEQQPSSDTTVGRLVDNQSSVPSEILDGVHMGAALLSHASPYSGPSVTLGSTTVSDSAKGVAPAESLRKAMQEFYHPNPMVVDQPSVAASRPSSLVNMHLHDAPKPQSLANPEAASKELRRLPRPFSGGTKWPEKSKPKLAAAAKDTLMSTAANVGKNISTEEIKAMLDQGPTYSQLCDVLENKGFVIHRSQFAQRLLSAVPSTNPQASGPALAQDTPKRGRGRPRNGGLPPQKRDTTLNTPQAITKTSNGMAQPATASVSNQRSTSHGTATEARNAYANGVYTGGAVQTPSGPAQGHFDQRQGPPPGFVKSGGPAASTQEFPQPPPGYSAWRSQDLPPGAMSPFAPLQRSGVSALSEPTSELTQGHKPSKTIRWADKRNVSQESLMNYGKVDLQTRHPIRTPGFQIHGRKDGLGNDSAPMVSDGVHSEISSKQGWTSEATNVSKSEVHDSPPTTLTKAEMARKRSFNEIVDLTEDLSEDNAIEEYKKARSKLHSSLPAGPIYMSSPNPAISNGSQSGKSKPQDANNLVHGNPTSAIAGLPGNPMFTGPLSEGDTLRLGDIVKPMQKKKALRRSTYNGKTIARDILISLGKHPTEKSLNWHLLKLHESFENVTDTSDLSTFRWDLVDPGGPSPPTPKVAGLGGQDAHHAPESQMTNLGGDAQPAARHGQIVAVAADMDGEVDIVAQANNESVQQAKGMLLAGRGKGSRSRGTVRVRGVQRQQPPSQHANIPVQPPEPTNKPSRGRGRGRPRGSGRGTRGSLHRQPLQQPQIPPTPRLPPNSSGGRIVAHGHTTQSPTAGESQQRQAGGSNGNPLPLDISQFAFREGTTTTEPGPSSSERRQSSIQVQLPIISSPAETPEKQRGRPPGSGKKRPSVENTVHPDDSNTPKRRGRPLGPAKALSLLEPPTPPRDGIFVMVPSRSPSLASSRLSGLKRSGGPHGNSKKRRETPRSRQPTSPSYQVYKCLWEGCKAELHNLETLRKHLYKLHCKQKAKETLRCLWRDCDGLEIDGPGEMIQQSQTRHAAFATEEEIKQHVEENHLQSLAWKLGDGPNAHPSG
ncbi:MAG: hypothetical protein Q9187_005642 [Circinaria calcarea]